MTTAHTRALHPCLLIRVQPVHTRRTHVLLSELQVSSTKQEIKHNNHARLHVDTVCSRTSPFTTIPAPIPEPRVRNTRLRTDPAPWSLAAPTQHSAMTAASASLTRDVGTPHPVPFWIMSRRGMLVMPGKRLAAAWDDGWMACSRWVGGERCVGGGVVGG